MKNVIFPLVLVLLYGCGGTPFTTADFTATAGAAGEPDDGGGTGGASASGGAQGATGGRGAGGAETGGHMAATGGHGDSTGGVSATGGASTGGVLTATGGAPVVDACVPVTHDNGIGQAWQDCVPLGTHNQTQAMKACAASGAETCTVINRCGGEYYEVDGYTNGNLVAFWMYGFLAAGYVNIASCGGPPCTPATDTCAKPWD